MYELVISAEAVERFNKALATACQMASDIFKAYAVAMQKMAESTAKIMDGYFDRLLYAANDNPKWWHLYKHAKKRRTRKKYYHMLVRQYLETLQA